MFGLNVLSARFPYNRSDRRVFWNNRSDYMDTSLMETVRSAIVAIATITITFSILAIVAIAIIAMLRSLSVRFPYIRSDR